MYVHLMCLRVCPSVCQSICVFILVVTTAENKYMLLYVCNGMTDERNPRKVARSEKQWSRHVNAIYAEWLKTQRSQFEVGPVFPVKMQVSPKVS